MEQSDDGVVVYPYEAAFCSDCPDGNPSERAVARLALGPDYRAWGCPQGPSRSVRRISVPGLMLSFDVSRRGSCRFGQPQPATLPELPNPE